MRLKHPRWVAPLTWSGTVIARNRLKRSWQAQRASRASNSPSWRIPSSSRPWSSSKLTKKKRSAEIRYTEVSRLTRIVISETAKTLCPVVLAKWNRRTSRTRCTRATQTMQPTSVRRGKEWAAPIHRPNTHLTSPQPIRRSVRAWQKVAL